MLRGCGRDGRTPKYRRGTRRFSPKVTQETFEDCAVTVKGNKAWMSGPLADELAEVARRAGMTVQEAFNYCIRIGLPLVLESTKPSAAVEKGKRNERMKSTGKGHLVQTFV